MCYTSPLEEDYSHIENLTERALEEEMSTLEHYTQCVSAALIISGADRGTTSYLTIIVKRSND